MLLVPPDAGAARGVRPGARPARGHVRRLPQPAHAGAAAGCGRDLRPRRVSRGVARRAVPRGRAAPAGGDAVHAVPPAARGQGGPERLRRVPPGRAGAARPGGRTPARAAAPVRHRQGAAPGVAAAARGLAVARRRLGRGRRRGRPSRPQPRTRDAIRRGARGGCRPRRDAPDGTPGGDGARHLPARPSQVSRLHHLPRLGAGARSSDVSAAAGLPDLPSRDAGRARLRALPRRRRARGARSGDRQGGRRRRAGPGASGALRARRTSRAAVRDVPHGPGHPVRARGRGGVQGVPRRPPRPRSAVRRVPRPRRRGGARGARPARARPPRVRRLSRARGRGAPRARPSLLPDVPPGAARALPGAGVHRVSPARRPRRGAAAARRAGGGGRLDVSARVWLLAAGVMAGAVPGALRAQGYRLRLDTRFQAAAYRGVTLDSIAVGDTVTGPGGGAYTPDGYAVNCVAGDAYCRFFRPGPAVHAAPVTATADLAAWGFGVAGLSVHATGRVAGDLGGGAAWPGSDAHVQLLEGYAEYAAERVTAQLGRQEVATRFGFTGFDGARVALRPGPRGLELTGYGGWGLARGIALPVTSPALNPLDDFQPVERQLVAGARAGWTSPWLDVRLDYLREVDPSTDYFVGERAGFDVSVRPAPGWSFAGGADYDLAAGWWGSAEAELGYAAAGGRWSAAIGVRRYPAFRLVDDLGRVQSGAVPGGAGVGVGGGHPVVAAPSPGRGVRLRRGGGVHADRPLRDERLAVLLGRHLLAGAGVDGGRRVPCGVRPGRVLPRVRGRAHVRAPRSAGGQPAGGDARPPARIPLRPVVADAVRSRRDVPALGARVAGARRQPVPRRPGPARPGGFQLGPGARERPYRAVVRARRGSRRSSPGGAAHAVWAGEPVSAMRVAVAVAALAALAPAKGGAQQVPGGGGAVGFDHAGHRKLFPACETCHRGAAEPGRSLWPDPATCEACHDGTIERRVAWQPPAAPRRTNQRFDHTPGAEVKVIPAQCVDCHADKGAPWMSVRRVAVQRCLDCHEIKTAHLAAPDTACALCHLPLARAVRLTREDIAAFPKPPSHEQPGFARGAGHGAAAERLTPVTPSCGVCHARDFCLQCHVDAPEQPAIQALPPDPRATAIAVRLAPPPSHADESFLARHGGVVRRDARSEERPCRE